MASAASFNWAATLDQARDVPPPTPVPGAGGTAFGSHDDLTDILTWSISFTSLCGAPVGMHFHGDATPGSNASVQVTIGLISGLNSPTVGQTTITDAQETGLLAGLWYINIHTSPNPSGEIRGQVNIVPLPAAAAFLPTALVGLGGLALA